ncbi:uncharacterized protein STEHIDRAFT_37986, partial [Stereum hirsutum FP-91666 SS1]|uniref:uncharacterized protein n=1 Tax=Stereum hirsutum (strain FP-91666) TaxID=721885 RepID=UPI000440BCF3
MKGNAICWSVPMPNIYKALPPTPEEMNEVLAFVYLGPEKPTEDDYKRTPLLVRKNKVKNALEWLKLNHDQYHDLTIAYDVLDRYSENTPIVVTDYRHSDNPIQPEATAVTGDESEEGTETGPCTFQVHGLVGSDLEHMNTQQYKAEALKHLLHGGTALGIGRSEEPESLWDNPTLYPQIFPWLFPYGKGGIGHALAKNKVEDHTRKGQLLLYHDK